jgi:CIC family chloride channel protein
MILLVLKLTGSFPAAVGVMVGVIVASVTVRLTFGYSFAAWRFHLRGVPIRGAYDIGWIHDLTVEKLMRRDVQTAPLGMTDYNGAAYRVSDAPQRSSPQVSERN